MTPQDSSSSSYLNTGSGPPSYGAVQPNNKPPPYAPLYAAPGPASAQPPQPLLQPGPRKRRTSLVTLLKITLFLVVLGMLVLWRSDTVADFIKFESEARRASTKSSALIAERKKWEVEKENMRHDRELWEKVPEDRVPPAANWALVRPSDACRAYGEREYWGKLQNIPSVWDPVDACINTPVRIKGVNIRRPHRCVWDSPHVYGYWIVDWDRDDCKPKHQDIRDTGCTNHRSGLTRIEAQVVGIIDNKEQDWRLMCESTPFTWGGFNYTSPIRCEERDLGTKVAVWDVPAQSCR